MLMLFGFRSIRISLPLPTVCEEREFTFLTVRLMLLLRLRCVVEILMFIVHWYVTSKALVMITSGIPCSDHRVESEFCSGIASIFARRPSSGAVCPYRAMMMIHNPLPHQQRSSVDAGVSHRSRERASTPCTHTPQSPWESSPPDPGEEAWVLARKLCPDR